MTFPVPPIERKLARANTAAAARRANQRMVLNTNNPLQSDVINATGANFVATQISATGLSPGAVMTYIIPWSAADINTDGMWSAGSPTLITIQTNGYYDIAVRVQISSGTALDTYTIAILKNGGAMGSGSTGSFVAATTSVTLTAETLASLVAGDVITVQIGNTGFFFAESVDASCSVKKVG